MLAPELDRCGNAFVFGEESLLRREGLPADLDLQRGVDADVADPVGVWPPYRADHCFAGFFVEAQDPEDCAVWRAGLAAGMDELQKGAAQQPPLLVLMSLSQNRGMLL